MSAVAPPPIELAIGYDETEVQKRSHKKTDEGVTTKVEIPIYSHGSKEELLRMIHQFTRGATIMEWTSGTQLFTQFSLHLEGVALTTWETLVMRVNQTAANFWTQDNQFKQHKFGPGALLNMKHYL